MSSWPSSAPRLRRRTSSSFSVRRAPESLDSVAMVTALFHTSPLSPAEWALAALVASSVLLLDEVRKWISRLGVFPSA